MNKPALKHAVQKGKEFPLLAFFGVIAFCLIVDQLTKYWAITVLKPIWDIPLIDGVLHLTYSQNTGMAFSMLSSHTWLLTVGTGILLTAMLAFGLAKRRDLPAFLQFVLAMVIGGGLGNLVDRVAYGYVVDFIYFKLIDFAIFNAADSFVVVGCILLMGYLIFAKEEPPKAKEKPDTEQEETHA